MKRSALQALLDEAYERHAQPGFIDADPIHIPKRFADRADAEIIGFLTATIAWGQRKTIIANAERLVQLMEGTPHAFVMDAGPRELQRLAPFVHRTFNGADLAQFIRSLRHLYTTYGGLEDAFLMNGNLGDMREGIGRFKQRFFEMEHAARSRKHVAEPAKGSNAKRINMYLRWMVRPNDRGVDLGLWKRIGPSDLMVPLDVHTGRVGRELGLLRRTQDDWKAVEELTAALRHFDADDPVKYDIALFGIGVSAGRRSIAER